MTNLKMQNSMMMSTFSVFEHKYPSWVNLVQEFKITSSKLNLNQILIRICKIQWCDGVYLSVLGWK